MNSLDALRLMVDHFPGGRPVMAVRLGLELDAKGDSEVLRKELSGSASHKLGVIRAHQISEICMDAKSPHCYAYVNAVCGSAGRMLDLPVREMTGKQDLRNDAAGLMKEGTDVLLELNSALADEEISDNELARIEREAAEVFERAQALVRGARARNAAGKPAYLKAAA
jgi:hypothetical protein